jgi:hypothetical protein
MDAYPHARQGRKCPNEDIIRGTYAWKIDFLLRQVKSSSNCEHHFETHWSLFMSLNIASVSWLQYSSKAFLIPSRSI